MSGALKKQLLFDIAITETALGLLSAASFVPSSGSTAISTLISPPNPSFSPIYNIGASSISPSPITTSPSKGILFSSFLIESTAAWSAAFLSPLPMKLYELIEAKDVTLVIESINFFRLIKFL